MILKALTEYYDILKKRDDVKDVEGVAPDGFDITNVFYAITIDNDGKVRNFQDLQFPQNVGKKTIIVPTRKVVPLQKARTNTPLPYFLCDNAKYLLGAWPEGNSEEEEKAKCYFAASKQFHCSILESIDDVQAQELYKFFLTWDFETHKNILNSSHISLKDLLRGNLVFRDFECPNDDFLENQAIKDAWISQRETENKKLSTGRCLVTGKYTAIAKKQPSIKGIHNSGPNIMLVSFDKPSFESYGKKKNENASVSEYVSEAYGKALSYLLEHKRCHRMFGNTDVVYWSETGEGAYSECFDSFFEALEETDADKLKEIMTSISHGKISRYKEVDLDPNTTFYILGVSSNIGSLSVKFFCRKTFGAFISNIAEHYKRLEIERPHNTELPDVFQLLCETVSQKNSKEEIPSALINRMLNAVLNNTRYPDMIFYNLLSRIRADKNVRNWKRAALIKAYLLKNKPQWKGVVNTMKLNEETECIAYLLGRLFAVLEEIQEAANSEINCTIKDKYFNAASTAPANTFRTLFNLSHAHMKTLKRDNRGAAINLDKKLIAITGRIQERFPSTLTLEEQGIFILGYYHQYQKKYESKKEDK